MMTSRLSRSRAAAARVAITGALGVLVAVAPACRRTMDVVQVRPPERTPIALRVATAVGDTLRVAVALGVGPVSPVGSLTGAVTADPAWTFVRCDAAQGSPLLACRADGLGADARVRLAAAWTDGTHAGDLMTLVFSRAGGGATGTRWQLELAEAHAVSGHNVLDSLAVRREVTP